MLLLVYVRFSFPMPQENQKEIILFIYKGSSLFGNSGANSLQNFITLYNDCVSLPVMLAMHHTVTSPRHARQCIVPV